MVGENLLLVEQGRRQWNVAFPRRRIGQTAVTVIEIGIQKYAAR